MIHLFDIGKLGARTMFSVWYDL